MNDKLKKDPSVIHCKVTVTAAINPATGVKDYVANYHPKTLKVTDSDTILVFQLTGNTPDDVRIASVKAVQEDNTQLSAATISKHGRMATMIDINTETGTFNLKFKFTNSKPDSTYLKCQEESVDYPEIDNNPPVPPT